MYFLRGQIQCQNARIKMFDSSFTRLNMFTSEHSMYHKTMVLYQRLIDDEFFK
jgi:hypothetical protein